MENNEPKKKEVMTNRDILNKFDNATVAGATKEKKEFLAKHRIDGMGESVFKGQRIDG